MNITPTQRELKKFWRSVTKQESGCWTCALNPSGVYSRLSVQGVRMMGHVFSYIIAKGDLTAGLSVCHECNNPRCVNPDHLRADTHTGNMRQMVAQGRHGARRGEENGNSIITDAQALEIRQKAANGVPLKQVAKDLGVTYQSAWQIARGRSRQNVGGPLLPQLERKILTAFEVIQIRSLSKAGVPQTVIARHIGTHQATVSNIVHGSKRRDVDFLLV